MIGVVEQEAFELLLVWAFAFYATAYLALFAVPLLARKDLGIRPALWLRAAAVSGFLVTLLYNVLSIFPIIELQDTARYSIKTASRNRRSECNWDCAVLVEIALSQRPRQG